MRFPVVPQQRGTEGLLAAGPSHHVSLGSQLFKVCGPRYTAVAGLTVPPFLHVVLAICLTGAPSSSFPFCLQMPGSKVQLTRLGEWVGGGTSSPAGSFP